MPIIQGSTPWGDILGGILSAGAQYVNGAEQAKQQNAARQRQAAIDAQNAQLTALSIANQKGQLTAQGLDTQGNRLPDPYTPTPGPMVQSDGAPSPSLNGVGQPVGPPAPGPMVAQPGVPNMNDHIAALSAAGMYGVAQRLTQQQKDQQALTLGNVDLQSHGFGPNGEKLATPSYTPVTPTMAPGTPIPSSSLNAKGQPVGPPAPGPMVAQPLTLRQQAEDLNRQAIAYSLAGQSAVGAEFAARATTTQKQADAADTAANQLIAATTEQEKALAQIHHWSVQETQAATDQAQNLAQRIQSGQLTYAAAMAHVGATYADINQRHSDHLDTLTQSQTNYNNSHNSDGSPKAASPVNPRQTQSVVALRQQYNNFLYNNGIKDTSNPVAQKRIAAWVAAQNFAPDVVSQVIPFAAGGAGAPATPVAPVNTVPPASPPTKINPANGKTYYLHAADGKYYLTR